MKLIGSFSKPAQIAFVIFLVMALSACALRRGREETPAITRFGNAEQLSEGATLVCSQECSARGFCGLTAAGDEVVLLNTLLPSTQTYNLFMPHNTAVNITGVDPQIARYKLSQLNEAVFYYKVANDPLGEGWVAGWCVGK